MSHLIEMDELNLSMESIREAARKVGLHVTERMTNVYGGTRVTGLAVSLPGWYKPVTYTEMGGKVKASYDNYLSNWGEITELEKFHVQVMAEMEGYDPSTVVLATRKTGETVFELEV